MYRYLQFQHKYIQKHAYATMLLLPSSSLPLPVITFYSHNIEHKVFRVLFACYFSTNDANELGKKYVKKEKKIATTSNKISCTYTYIHTRTAYNFAGMFVTISYLECGKICAYITGMGFLYFTFHFFFFFFVYEFEFSMKVLFYLWAALYYTVLCYSYGAVNIKPYEAGKNVKEYQKIKNKKLKQKKQKKKKNAVIEKHFYYFMLTSKKISNFSLSLSPSVYVCITLHECVRVCIYIFINQVYVVRLVSSKRLKGYKFVFVFFSVIIFIFIFIFCFYFYFHSLLFLYNSPQPPQYFIFLSKQNV